MPISNWARDNQGWALRSLKLRMSRKLTFAAGIVYAFQLADTFWADTAASRGDRRVVEAIGRLWDLGNRTPLDLLAGAFDRSPVLAAAARDAFDAYDSFLALLNTKTSRDHLKDLSEDGADSDAVYQQVRELGRRFETSLLTLFVRNRATPYPELIETCGVFGCRPSDSQLVRCFETICEEEPPLRVSWRRP